MDFFYDLTIIIPVFNEEKTIDKTIEILFEKIKNQDKKVQVIVIDDGSKDETKNILKEKTQDNFLFLFHNKNQGKGSAIRTGLNYVKGKYIVIQDADLEYDPKDIFKMLEKIENENLKVLFGSRLLNKENKKGRGDYLWGGKLVTFFTNILYGQKLTDEPTCYKMFLSEELLKMPLKCKRFEFCPEVTAYISKAGNKIKEIPISYYPRTKDQGKKIAWHDGVEALWTLIKLKFKKVPFSKKDF